MKRLAWLIAALAAATVGCVEAEPDRTNVVIDRESPPANTMVIEKDNDPAPAGETNVDVDIDTTDETPDVVIE